MQVKCSTFHDTVRTQDVRSPLEKGQGNNAGCNDEQRRGRRIKNEGKKIRRNEKEERRKEKE